MSMDKRHPSDGNQWAGTGAKLELACILQECITTSTRSFQ